MVATKSAFRGAPPKKAASPPAAKQAMRIETVSTVELFDLFKSVDLTCGDFILKVVSGDISEDIRKNCALQRTIWISIDPTTMVRKRNRVTFTVKVAGRKFSFEGGVMAHATGNTASQFFLKATREHRGGQPDWTRLTVDDTMFVERSAKELADAASHEQKDVQPKEKKRPREGALPRIQPADKEAALELFKRFWAAADESRPMDLQLINGSSIREALRVSGGKTAVTKFWLALDYDGKNLYEEDIVTFQSKIACVEGPAFKAFISPVVTNAEKKGKLLVAIIAEPAGQFSTFEVYNLKDSRVEIENAADPQPMEIDQEVPIEVSEERVELPDDEQANDLEDFGLGDLVRDTVSRGVKKLKADAETSTQRIKGLQEELTDTQRQVRLQTERADRATEDVSLMAGEKAVLTAQLNFSLNKISVMERRLADGKQGPVSNQPEIDGKLQESLTELQEKYVKAQSEINHMQEAAAHMTTVYNARCNDFFKLDQRCAGLQQELEAQRVIHDQQAVAIPAPVVVITHAEARAAYLENNRARLESEARSNLYAEIKQRLNDQLSVDAYREIIQSSPAIRTMVEDGLAGAIADEKQTNAEDVD